jgi:predicted transposase/invertase (TIGR01784 family)
MARYLDPRNDLTFKYIFGEHEHLCRSLLNSILPLEAHRQIVSLQYGSPELVPEIPILKDSIVDIFCTDNIGRQFIVEMQMVWTSSFKSRVLLNASKAYVMQLDTGQDYRLIQPVYALNFVNDIFEPESAEHYHDYRIVNIKDTDKQIEGLELIFIELPKFKPGGRAEKKLYDLWLKFLTAIKGNTDEAPSELLEEEVTNEALRYLERNSYTKGQLATYNKYWDIVRTERTRDLDARAEGMAEGEAKGEAKGEEERKQLAAALAREREEKEAKERALKDALAEIAALKARSGNK